MKKILATVVVVVMVMVTAVTANAGALTVYGTETSPNSGYQMDYQIDYVDSFHAIVHVDIYSANGKITMVNDFTADPDDTGYLVREGHGTYIVKVDDIEVISANYYNIDEGESLLNGLIWMFGLDKI